MPETISSVSPPHRPYGMHPLAFDLYLTSGIPLYRIGQTIGHASASGDTHSKTGSFEGHDYGACFDLHVTDLTHAQAIEEIVTPLASLGFAAYVRVPGEDHWPAYEHYHVHCIYPACNVTESVDHQLRDWLHEPDTLNGLRSHVRYSLYQTRPEWGAACEPLYAQRRVVML